MDWLRKEVDNLKKLNLYNNILILESSVGSEVKINGKKLLNFCSNNYLGLANHPKLASGAMSPSIEKTPSVITNFLIFFGAFCNFFSRSFVFVCKYLIT